MILSIIIPVYNVECYIKKCLYSCLSQDIELSDYEIIVVNDGTEDSSMSIIQDIVNQYDNVRVISQSNKGLSVARNQGLLLAKGDYVWFVDSDDWIEHDCLNEITSSLVNDIDLLQLQYRYVYDDERKNYNPLRYEQNGVLSGREIIKRGGLPAPVPFTIYRRLFLLNNGFSFVPGIYHEDSEFKPRVVYCAEKIAAIDLVCYNYYQRALGSITSCFRIKNAFDILRVMNNLHDFSRSFAKEEYKAFGDFISLNMNTLLRGYQKISCEEQCRIRKILKEERHLFDRMIHSTKLKYQLEGVLFFIHIELGIYLYKLILYILIKFDFNK